MPRCDTCGFAHAQPDRCINCGNPDPFRRFRIIKLSFLVAALLLALVAMIYFYQRYNQIERSVRAAEISAQSEESAYTTPPAETQP